MKRVILSIFIIAFTLSASLLAFGIIIKVHNHKQLALKIQKLPSFSFMTLKSQSFNSCEIKKGPVLVVRFHPECEHCRYEISEIMKSKIPVSGISVIMVSSAEPDSIRNLFSRYDLSDYPSIIPLVDTAYIFENIFGSDIVPSNYIYNNELDLVRVFYGETKTETIFKYLNSNEQDK